jgi:hypothetical protein
MGKIMIVTVSEDEEHILMDIQQYLQSKATYVAVHSEQNMIFSYPNFEIDLYHREVQYNKKEHKLFGKFLYSEYVPNDSVALETVLRQEEWKRMKMPCGKVENHIRNIRKSAT